MELTVDLSALWARVSQMGATKVDVDIGEVWEESDVEFDDQLSSSGIEINLSELESNQGLLSIRGRQVLLFIPDHSFQIEKALVDAKFGKKFHVADCITLEEAKRKNRFERYKVTNNLSGVFEIYGTSDLGKEIQDKARLNVCKNCINLLNFKGAANKNKEARDSIVRNFDIEEFFTTYSSLFNRLPRQHVANIQKGYAENWKTISSAVRQSFQNVCQHCFVDLSTDKRLLHVHHKNGEKSDNSSKNLIPLCADCHRKEPFHGHMYVKLKDTQRINELRTAQRVFAECDWPTVRKKVDPSLIGVVEHCESNNYNAPHVAYTVTDEVPEKEITLELAWPARKLGVTLEEPVDINEWRIFTLKEALKFFSERPKRC